MKYGKLILVDIGGYWLITCPVFSGLKGNIVEIGLKYGLAAEIWKIDIGGYWIFIDIGIRNMALRLK